MFLINSSFSSGEFPDCLKLSSVIPVFKKGDSTKDENYRPISLLSAFSKILEKAMHGRLLGFFDICKLISRSQHGFLKDKSTQTAIFEFVTRIIDFIEDKKIVMGLFLDLSKAFDCLDSEILFHKLQLYGVRGLALQWIRSYFTNRKQKVIIKDGSNVCESGVLVNNLGVPQGSILGPLFFVIYVNDLHLNLRDHQNEFILNYADDTNLLISGNSLKEVLHRASDLLTKIETWFSGNKLVFNKDKTSCVIFKTKQNKTHIPETLLINKTTLPVAEESKFLGIKIDDSLGWSGHMSDVSARLSSILYTLRFSGKYLTREASRTIYFANFQSVLSYGITFWGSSSRINQIFILQKMALRIMIGLRWHESCRDHFKNEKILTVPALFIYRTIVFLSKNFNYNLKRVHVHDTRHTAELNCPIHKLSLTERSCQYLGVKFYNKVAKVINLTSDNKLNKKLIYNYLVCLEPYCVDDFMSIKS